MAPELEMVLRLLLAGALGAIIGYQRERAGKSAGLRTHTLVSLGAAIFTLASVYGFIGADPARVAAGVVAGIGFIGAGSIIRGQEGFVSGLTTAASLWAVAGVGLAAGTGLYILAPVATLLILIVLWLPRHIRG
jgi:putative Mg2+ transporter-C (MgtC) family protein